MALSSENSCLHIFLLVCRWNGKNKGKILIFLDFHFLFVLCNDENKFMGLLRTHFFLLHSKTSWESKFMGYVLNETYHMVMKR